jgi:hypothetical protein
MTTVENVIALLGEGKSCAVTEDEADWCFIMVVHFGSIREGAITGKETEKAEVGQEK